jgi:hypothetical protein
MSHGNNERHSTDHLDWHWYMTQENFCLQSLATLAIIKILD